MTVAARRGCPYLVSCAWLLGCMVIPIQTLAGPSKHIFNWCLVLVCFAGTKIQISSLPNGPIVRTKFDGLTAVTLTHTSASDTITLQSESRDLQHTSYRTLGNKISCFNLFYLPVSRTWRPYLDLDQLIPGHLASIINPIGPIRLELF